MSTTRHSTNQLLRPGVVERITALAMRTVGQASECIRLGYARGFDSGEMMEAIYRDQPAGRWLVGPLIDRLYLSQPGCRGLRGRKRLLIEIISAVVREQEAVGLRPAVLDLAAGPATYLRDLLASEEGRDLEAIARDRDVRGLDRGRTLARQAGIGERLRFEVGDALDAGAVAALRPRPTLVIASGFYELLLDEAVIARSMAIVRDVLEPGGAFVFTTQVAHPQVAMMAAVPAHDGRPWMIRNRPVEEAEALARAAGFDEIRSTFEPTGIFAVSVAHHGDATGTPGTPTEASRGRGDALDPDLGSGPLRRLAR